MRRQHSTRPAIVLLAGAIGMLLALNWFLFRNPVDISPIDQAKGTTNAPVAPNLKLATPLDNKSAAQFAEAVNRPLFNPDRRPVKREVTAADSVDPQPSELQLVGVMKSGRSGARALIRASGTQAGKWIAEGEQFNGWTLRNIGERSVVVEAGGRSHQLTLGAPRRQPEEAPVPERGAKRR
jgi:hypothetical protein